MSVDSILGIVLLSAVIPYLLGSISFSIIVSRLLFGKDIRDFGSGNAGMTNILRTFGKGAAALTLAGDIGKGYLAVWLMYFGFRGGKAVATATGTIIAIQPVLVLPLLAIFILVFAAGKMVSLASVSCAVAYPIVTFCYYYFTGWYAPEIVATATIGSAIVGALVVWLHRGNIARIRAGTEYKFFQKKNR